MKTFPPDAIDDPNVTYTAAVVDAEDSGSEQTPMESSDMGQQQHLALVTQEDGTQQQVMDCGRVAEGGGATGSVGGAQLDLPVSRQVSISEADLQAMGGTITMVTQEGTTITIPAHELAAQGTHSVTMVTADGSDEQVGVAGTSVSGLFIWEETHQSFSCHSERDCWRTAHVELVNMVTSCCRAKLSMISQSPITFQHCFFA